MAWFSIDFETLDDERLATADEAHRSAWFHLIRYLAGQKSGDLIRGSKQWSAAKWMMLARVDSTILEEGNGLWAWKRNDLCVWGYPFGWEKFNTGQRTRGSEGGKKAAEARAKKKASAATGDTTSDATSDATTGATSPAGSVGSSQIDRKIDRQIDTQGSEVREGDRSLPEILVPLRDQWRTWVDYICQRHGRIPPVHTFDAHVKELVRVAKVHGRPGVVESIRQAIAGNLRAPSDLKNFVGNGALFDPSKPNAYTGGLPVFDEDPPTGEATA